jgi:hypothetical protein
LLPLLLLLLLLLLQMRATHRSCCCRCRTANIEGEDFRFWAFLAVVKNQINARHFARLPTKLSGQHNHTGSCESDDDTTLVVVVVVVVVVSSSK